MSPSLIDIDTIPPTLEIPQAWLDEHARFLNSGEHQTWWHTGYTAGKNGSPAHWYHDQPAEIQPNAAQAYAHHEGWKAGRDARNA